MPITKRVQKDPSHSYFAIGICYLLPGELWDSDLFYHSPRIRNFLEKQSGIHSPIMRANFKVIL